MDDQKIISDITEAIVSQGVDRLILFGSSAYGNQTPDSDIDLMVVAPADSFSANNRERMDLSLQYNQVITEFRKQVPMDLIVHTRATFQKFIQMESMFSKEITNMVAFHAPQAIEKSFKAVIEEFYQGNVKTHRLQSLYSKIDSVISGINERILAEPDTVYIEARYPGDLGLMPLGSLVEMRSKFTGRKLSILKIRLRKFYTTAS